MTPLAQLAKINREAETKKAATDFAAMVHFILRHGSISKAGFALEKQGAQAGVLDPKLRSILKAGGSEISRESLMRHKAAVVAGGLTSSPFADYSVAAQGFAASLVNAGAFDAMLSSMVPLPLLTQTAGAVSVGATAYSISEGSAKPVSRLTVVGQQVTPQKAHAILVVTDELARAPGAGAIALISRELRNAVALVTDQQFFTTILTGIVAGTSTGVSAESVRADISGLLRSVTTGQNSKLFLVVTPLICKMWSMLTSGVKGDSAFPELGPLGGEINSIPVLVSDGLSTGQVVLVDASGIGAASGDIGLNEMSKGTVVLDTAPDSPPSASTAYISLWQQNMRAVVCERFFIAVRLRSDACATLTNSNSYQGGNSPP